MTRHGSTRTAAGFLGITALVLTTTFLSGTAHALERPPNFIVIFCDDMGYGDVGCFGSEKHRTPNLDRMAEEGRKFTSFYVTSGVCTPSRSSIMTGCYPRRVNMHTDHRGAWVLFPVSPKGLNPDEITIAEVLKPQGYATMCIGKWHLGDQKTFLPTRQGFDSFFGLPYSNDMKPPRKGNPPLPLLRDETVIEAPVDQTQLTKRYTEEAVAFIRKNKDHPFFLYLPHTMVHNPVYSSEAFHGKSANSGYGDATQEVDWSTGEILKTLRELGMAKRTLVIFTSDNGASNRWGGSNAPLSGFKGSTMEGGMREPCIMWWPDMIPAGTVCDELACTMDLLPTFAKLAGAEAPRDRIIDGLDIWPLIRGQRDAKTPREAFYYYHLHTLQAVRSGKWKLHLPAGKKDRKLRLIDLEADIAEKTDLSAQHPEVVKRLQGYAEKARRDLGDGEQAGENQRPAGLIDKATPLLLPGTTFEVPGNRTSFPLKPGAVLDGGRAPRVAKRGFTIQASVDAQGKDGVILAQGGEAVGYALFVEGSKPAFCVRTDWEKQVTVTGKSPLPAGKVEIRFILERLARSVHSERGFGIRGRNDKDGQGSVYWFSGQSPGDPVRARRAGHV